MSPRIDPCLVAHVSPPAMCVAGPPVRRLLLRTQGQIIPAMTRVLFLLAAAF